MSFFICLEKKINERKIKQNKTKQKKVYKFYFLVFVFVFIIDIFRLKHNYYYQGIILLSLIGWLFTVIIYFHRFRLL